MFFSQIIAKLEERNEVMQQFRYRNLKFKGKHHQLPYVVIDKLAILNLHLSTRDPR